jgi:hypothetical protein
MFTNQPSKYTNRLIFEKKNTKKIQKKFPTIKFQKMFFSNIGRFIYQNVQNQILRKF